MRQNDLVLLRIMRCKWGYVMLKKQSITYRAIKKTPITNQKFESFLSSISSVFSSKIWHYWRICWRVREIALVKIILCWVLVDKNNRLYGTKNSWKNNCDICSSFLGIPFTILWLLNKTKHFLIIRMKALI